MDTLSGKQVFGDSPSRVSLPCASSLRLRYELLLSLGEYVGTATRRGFEHHRTMVDRFELQGNHLFVRVAPLDVQGVIRWLATNSALDILQRAELDQVTIVRDDALISLQI